MSLRSLGVPDFPNESKVADGSDIEFHKNAT